MDISIVIPCYNEARIIRKSISELNDAFYDSSLTYEIIIVNDGSTDNTAKIIHSIPGVRTIDLKRNYGKGYAVRAGLRAGSGEYRLFIDADHSTSLSSVMDGVERIFEIKKLALIGSRRTEGSKIVVPQGFVRSTAGKLGNFLVRALVIDIRDTQCGFKIFHSTVIDEFFDKLKIDSWAFDVEILAALQDNSIDVVEHPVRWRDSTASNVRASDYLVFIRDLIDIRRASKKKEYGPGIVESNHLLYRSNIPAFSVVIPCYNEEGAIGNLLNTFSANELSRVLVVDNNSNDDTASIAQECGAQVILEQDQGVGHAYRSGFVYAQGEIIVVMDGDGQHSIEDANKLVETLQTENADFINGTRFGEIHNHMSSLRRFGNFVQTLFCNVLFGVSLSDSQSGLWAFRSQILPSIECASSGHDFVEEMKVRAILDRSIKFIECPVAVAARDGKSRLSPLKDGIKNLFRLVLLFYEVKIRRITQ